MSLVTSLPDDSLLLVLHMLLEEKPHQGDVGLVSAVSLACASRDLQTRFHAALQQIRSMLPPPYSPGSLDAAIAGGDPAVAEPLLREAMGRLKHNIDLITATLLDKGYPVAVECAACRRPYLTAMDGDAVREHAEEPVTSRGMRLPLALQVFWEEIGGVALASPQDGAHHDWWNAMHPELLVQVGESGTPFAPDPLWIGERSFSPHPLYDLPRLILCAFATDHSVEVLRYAVEEQTQPPVTLPVGFSDEEGFIFRQGHVLHLAPDALSKRQAAMPSAAAAPGSYACWLTGDPDLDPELLRFTPPNGFELGGAEPLLWRARCSFISYLRIAVLEGGGFPGCLGFDAFEPLREELTKNLRPF